jgi:hypothetical protein
MLAVGFLVEGSPTDKQRLTLDASSLDELKSLLLDKLDLPAGVQYQLECFDQDADEWTVPTDLSSIGTKAKLRVSHLATKVDVEEGEEQAAEDEKEEAVEDEKEKDSDHMGGGDGTHIATDTTHIAADAIRVAADATNFAPDNVHVADEQVVALKEQLEAAQAEVSAKQQQIDEQAMELKQQLEAKDLEIEIKQAELEEAAEKEQARIEVLSTELKAQLEASHAEVGAKQQEIDELGSSSDDQVLELKQQFEAAQAEVDAKQIDELGYSSSGQVLELKQQLETATIQSTGAILAKQFPDHKTHDLAESNAVTGGANSLKSKKIVSPAKDPTPANQIPVAKVQIEVHQVAFNKVEFKSFSPRSKPVRIEFDREWDTTDTLPGRGKNHQNQPPQEATKPKAVWVHFESFERTQVRDLAAIVGAEEKEPLTTEI